MARTASSQPVDLTTPANLSAGIIARLACPPGKSQAFLRDTVAPGLRVRVAPTGAKSFVVERKVGQRTVRRAIGDVRNWTIEAAREEARRVYVLLDQGVAPEDLRPVAEKPAADPAVVGPASEAWAIYLADRKPHWGARHYDDHVTMSSAGGVPYKRGKGKTQPGLLHGLLGSQLSELSPRAVEAWAAEQAKTRPSQARLALRLLSAFLNWCSEQEAFRNAVPTGAAAVKSRRTRDALGKSKVKQDALMREQLRSWFAAVCSMGNPTISAYLQVMLLSGARPGEVRAMRWADVDWAWRGVTIHDKVEGSRVIPLTPYVAHVLRSLPTRNEWVFASVDAAEGIISSPNDAHRTACIVAGIAPVSLHGLRRSFKSLTEWLEMPAGVVAQIMGHKPSATAEKHYTVRPLDLLRVHHERIEAWVLEQAGVVFDPKVPAPRLVAIGK